MTVVVRQAMSDDDGTFTFGTAVNKAFIDQLYDQVDDQTHSVFNPTVKPKTITDEVITARGAEVNLAAKLATLVSTNYLLGSADLGTTWKVAGGRSLQFDDADVAHGMTALFPTSVWASISAISGTAGGAFFTGLSDVDQVGLHLWGINGSAAPTTPALILRGSKKSGTTTTVVAAAEPLLQITNDGGVKAQMYGDGALYLTQGLAVGYVGQASDDSVHVGDASFKLNFNAGAPRIEFEGGHYLSFDRTTDALSMSFTGTPRFTINDIGTLVRGLVVSGATIADAVSGVIVLKEIAAPGVGGADTCRIYAEDNGAGKTRLMAIFSSGAAQQLAIQP